MKKLSIIFVLALIIGLVPFADSLAVQSSPNRHTFTWISKVTPELAKWAKELHFTDVVCSDASNESYQNLVNEGITYWYAVTAYALDFSNSSSIKAKLDELTQASPNGNIYIDDIHILLQDYDSAVATSFFDTIRQTNGEIMMNGYTYDTPGIYEGLDLSGINFDAYQPTTVPYDMEPLKSTGASLGIYIWVWYGFPWPCMTEENLSSNYNIAGVNNLSRIVIWGGYSDEFYECCLYNYPQWWDTIRSRNAAFLEG